MKEFYALLLVAFLGNAASRTARMGSAFATLEEGWGFLAALAAAFSLGRLASSFLGGELSKKYGSKVTSLGLASLGATGLGYALLPPSYYPLLRAFHGFSAGFTWPSLQAITMSKVPREYRGRASSLYFVSGNLAWFFAFALGGLLAESALVPSALALFALSLAVLAFKGKAVEERRKGKGKAFVPPLSALVMTSIALGIMTVLVNTEVAVAVFGREFGKAFGGLLLAAAALVGSIISYFLNKKLIDISESHLSMLLPAVGASLSGFLISAPPPLSALGLFSTKALTMWWRSSALGLARAGDVGRRVGAFNAAGDFGRLLGSLASSLGPWTVALLPALSLALGTLAWAHSRSTLSTSSAE
ncbi:MFS transporter [Ignicoccus hospitalis]|uniref:Major facilitator superfamily MFS_1 n=1 Tax=Ignicoccus hospitalis (strain KIN4/I / DSM 18386 / JCM 14125) TaxID=453591 RepID=A8A983_IGNH4|nr:MFS transporter [Ignicoccus hospitalis]ABU81485.1 major facilitator superfamily MFS_1 [Ignicoccus hospitalis KIN4/I]HIH90207.1 MFS transporter [Desulfurococcaceae archaeon]